MILLLIAGGLIALHRYAGNQTTVREHFLALLEEVNNESGWERETAKEPRYLVFGKYLARYEEIGISTDEKGITLGKIVGEAMDHIYSPNENFFRVKGFPDCYYLICKDAEGEFSVWEFRCFVVAENEQEKEQWMKDYGRLELTSYTVGTYLSIIWNLESASDIRSISVYEISGGEGSLAFKDEEKTPSVLLQNEEALMSVYDALQSAELKGSWQPLWRSRFQPRFSRGMNTNDLRLDRQIVIELNSGTRIDDVYYSGAYGCFYRRFDSPKDVLSDLDMQSLNQLFGFRDE